ncbi:MAG: hypothetical protein SFV54_23555 [Bryobacteraceae bacterium]|nr:hypothetical protein [Bryobacteraceae bacterium]
MSRRAVWMNLWDLEGRPPQAVLDHLENVGLNGCRIGLAYHGGRMLLPGHASRVVYEQPLSPGLTAPLELLSFLEAAEARRFHTAAWLVLCHNDLLGEASPHLCITNAFDERYPYALCPAQPEVQDHCIQLCRRAAEIPGIAELDLEALSFMGYEHQGLHDKRGIPLPAAISWQLSLCCCDRCAGAVPELKAALQTNIRHWLTDPYAEPPTLPGPLQQAALAWRRKVQKDLLCRIRQALPRTTLNIRTSQTEAWAGGKCTLRLEDLAEYNAEATYTWFGATLEDMRTAIARIPAHPAVPLTGGFVFHEPDCRSAADVAARLELLAASPAADFNFYGFSMAAPAHWRWLQQALKGLPTK